jgi:hypothetical protein
MAEPPPPAPLDVRGQAPITDDQWAALQRDGLTLDDCDLVDDVFGLTDAARRELLATTPGAYQKRLLAAVTDPEASSDDVLGEIMVDMYGDNVRVGKGKQPRVYLVGAAGTWEEEQSGGAVLVRLLQPLVRVCSDALQYYTVKNDPDAKTTKAVTRYFGDVLKDLTCDAGRVGMVQKLKFRAVDVAFEEKLAKPKPQLLPLKDGYLFDWSRKADVAATYVAVPYVVHGAPVGQDGRVIVSKAEYLRQFLRRTSPLDYVTLHLDFTSEQVLGVADPAVVAAEDDIRSKLSTSLPTAGTRHWVMQHKAAALVGLGLELDVFVCNIGDGEDGKTCLSELFRHALGCFGHRYEPGLLAPESFNNSNSPSAQLARFEHALFAFTSEMSYGTADPSKIKRITEGWSCRLLFSNDVQTILSTWLAQLDCNVLPEMFDPTKGTTRRVVVVPWRGLPVGTEPDLGYRRKCAMDMDYALAFLRILVHDGHTHDVLVNGLDTSLQNLPVEIRDASSDYHSSINPTIAFVQESVEQVQYKAHQFQRDPASVAIRHQDLWPRYEAWWSSSNGGEGVPAGHAKATVVPSIKRALMALGEFKKNLNGSRQSGWNGMGYRGVKWC